MSEKIIDYVGCIIRIFKTRNTFLCTIKSGFPHKTLRQCRNFILFVKQIYLNLLQNGKILLLLLLLLRVSFVRIISAKCAIFCVEILISIFK